MSVRLRFSKSVRLSRASEFQQLKREGTSFHGKYMVLSVLKKMPADAVARVGIITSKRVGCAVVRNRVRRQLREIYRHAQPRLVRGIWLVIVARQYAARAVFPKMQEEWWSLARRSGILTPEGGEPCSS